MFGLISYKFIRLDICVLFGAYLRLQVESYYDSS
jgi:hypothetical protein